MTFRNSNCFANLNPETKNCRSLASRPFGRSFKTNQIPYVNCNSEATFGPNPIQGVWLCSTQLSSARPSSAQLSLAQPSSATLSPAQPSSAQLSPAQLSPAQLSSAWLSPAQFSSAQLSPAQLGVNTMDHQTG